MGKDVDLIKVITHADGGRKVFEKRIKLSLQ